MSTPKAIFLILLSRNILAISAFWLPWCFKMSTTSLSSVTVTSVTAHPHKYYLPQDVSRKHHTVPCPRIK